MASRVVMMRTMRGHLGASGGSRLPPAPKRVIKQQNNDSKPWFRVPKVCPDPNIMGQYYGEMLAETGSFDVLFW